MTTVTEKLAPTVERVRTVVTDKALVAEQSILSAPRLYRKSSLEAVYTYMFRAVVGLAIAIYMLASGKALVFNVKDRSINKVGRIGAIISLVSSPVIIVLGAHEIWARLRSRQPESLAEIIRTLVIEKGGPRRTSPFGASPRNEG